jgi:hypothetical protein
MKAIRKQLKGYFAMFMVKFSLGYIIVQGGLLYWLVSLIQIGLVTLMIRSLLQVLFLALVQDLSLGPVRRVLSSGKCKSGSHVASIDPFRFWIPTPTYNQPLV